MLRADHMQVNERKGGCTAERMAVVKFWRKLSLQPGYVNYPDASPGLAFPVMGLLPARYTPEPAECADEAYGRTASFRSVKEPLLVSILVW